MERTGRSKRKQEIQKKEELRKRRTELLYHTKPILLTFLVWFAATVIIHIPAIGDRIAPFFVSFTAYSTYFFGKILFLPVELQTIPYITVNGFTMEVVMECTAYNFYLIVIILTLFSRWSMKHKLVSLGYFLITVFVMNKLRFIIMGYVGSVAAIHFDAIHDYLWNIIFGFLVFGIWVWRELTFKKQIKYKAPQ